jgi:hypothetical protein
MQFGSLAAQKEGHRRRAIERVSVRQYSDPTRRNSTSRPEASSPTCLRLVRGWRVGSSISWRWTIWHPSPTRWRRDFLTTATARRVLAENPAWNDELGGNL